MPDQKFHQPGISLLRKAMAIIHQNIARTQMELDAMLQV